MGALAVSRRRRVARGVAAILAGVLLAPLFAELLADAFLTRASWHGE
jgi:hypothetical protein